MYLLEWLSHYVSKGILQRHEFLTVMYLELINTPTEEDIIILKDFN